MEAEKNTNCSVIFWHCWTNKSKTGNTSRKEEENIFFPTKDKNGIGLEAMNGQKLIKGEAQC